LTFSCLCFKRCRRIRNKSSCKNCRRGLLGKWISNSLKELVRCFSFWKMDW